MPHLPGGSAGGLHAVARHTVRNVILSRIRDSAVMMVAGLALLVGCNSELQTGQELTSEVGVNDPLPVVDVPQGCADLDELQEIRYPELRRCAVIAMAELAGYRIETLRDGEVVMVHRVQPGGGSDQPNAAEVELGGDLYTVIGTDAWVTTSDAEVLTGSEIDGSQLSILSELEAAVLTLTEPMFAEVNTSDITLERIDSGERDAVAWMTFKSTDPSEEVSITISSGYVLMDVTSRVASGTEAIQIEQIYGQWDVDFGIENPEN